MYSHAKLLVNIDGFSPCKAPLKISFTQLATLEIGPNPHSENYTLKAYLVLSF